MATALAQRRTLTFEIPFGAARPFGEREPFGESEPVGGNTVHGALPGGVVLVVVMLVLES
jgi:hypothetical protein